MNIFILDRDPQLSAQYMCDKHVVKMCLETAQILCTALHKLGIDPDKIPYKKTHENHPCCVWASENFNNFFYLHKVGKELCKEYTFRYNKKHKCESILLEAYNALVYSDNQFRLITKTDFFKEPQTPFPQAMPDKYKDSDAVWAYRQYYIGEKNDIAQWEKGRESPKWWPYD